MEKPKALQFVPGGYSVFTTNCGIKDKTLDLGVVFSDVPADAAAIFTTNTFPGEPIKIGREHIKNGRLQAIVVNSKNANVATGPDGYQRAYAICEKVAKETSIDTALVLPSSTGVIGYPLPFEKVVDALNNLNSNLVSPADFIGFAKAIMTTDTFPKFVSARVGNASIVGVAKGSGMIEPNMATMLSYFFTDAKIPQASLSKFLKKAADKSFNCLSIDSDTSTSDTLAILANGLAGEVDEEEFYAVFESLCIDLTKMLAVDGEGATKLFTVDISGARSHEEALKIGKSIINSPLVKTMIYKGDPNWGRIVMAVGKTHVEVPHEDLKIAWGENGELENLDDKKALSAYLQNNSELFLKVKVGNGPSAVRVYGCDLTEDYVKINAYYTT